ncbi:hypothetical protein E3T37_12645 [Cryobacterium sp. TMT2-10]|nr:hypothetical protein E3T37_12645 [Cryobacterium sp. TMT2-10]
MMVSEVQRGRSDSGRPFLDFNSEEMLWPDDEVVAGEKHRRNFGGVAQFPETNEDSEIERSELPVAQKEEVSASRCWVDKAYLTEVGTKFLQPLDAVLLICESGFEVVEE